jgi:putative ABC transport system permease protein
MSNYFSIVKVALWAISKNKVRAALTTLGIVIGVGSVIAMISLGQGARQQVQEQIASLGSNLLQVRAGSEMSHGARSAAGSDARLKAEDATAIQNECASVAFVSPSVRATAQVIYGNQNWNTRVEGVNENFPAIRDWPVSAGEFFSASDIRTASRVAVLGQTVADNLFVGIDPLGQTIRIRNLSFRVIGVLKAKGLTGWGMDQDDTIMAPYTTVMKKLLDTSYIQQIYVSAAGKDATFKAEEEIKGLLRQRHNLPPSAEDDFTVRNLTDLSEAADQSNKIMTILLSSIAGVSLLVGGIGIMNIMLVSVMERTREIGVRMAVGARATQIQWQFLTESLVLSLGGGVLGVLLGVAMSILISTIFGWPRLISLLSIFLAFLFSAGVGMFFGFYPAYKASRLNPVEALRYE